MQGQKNGEIDENVNAYEFGSLFIMLVEGGILLSKTTGDEKHLSFALDRISLIIDKELKLLPS
ncbi:hypothetical protein [Chryseobacterium wanjuense]